MRTITTLAGTAAAALALSLGATAASAAPLPAPGPSASAPCLSPQNAGYCGSQRSVGSQDFSPVGLLIGVTQSGQVTARQAPEHSFPGFNFADPYFLWLPVAGHKVAQYDPDGPPADTNVAGEYLTDVATGPHSGVVRLEPGTVHGGPGASQEWDAIDQGNGFEWKNVASHRIIQVTTNGGPVLTVTLPVHPTSAELFNFAQNTQPSPFGPIHPVWPFTR